MKSVSLRNLLIIIMLIFLYIQNYFFTNNDNLSLILFIISSLTMYIAILKIQSNHRKVAKIFTKEGSFLHTFFNNDNSLLTKIISLFISLILSFFLILILKGISINHGNVILFIIIALISFSIFNFITTNNISNESVNKNLQEDIVNHGNDFVRLFIGATILTVILSLLLSAKDTYTFSTVGELKINNFIDKASDSQIIKNGYNDISRKLMNFYIIMDNFKMAIANHFIEVFFSQEQRSNFFYIFYFCIFILNVMKLYAFSFSFLLLQKGLLGFTEKLLPHTNRFLQKIDEKRKDKDSQ